MLARVKQALAVTEAAAERIQALLAKRGKPSVGLVAGRCVRLARLLGAQLHDRICRTREANTTKSSKTRGGDDTGRSEGRSCLSSGLRWIMSKRSCRAASPSAIPNEKGTVAAAVSPSTSKGASAIAYGSPA